MEEWVKIFSFDTQYQAELTKGLLEQNEIRTVIVNAKDSFLLIGEYDLYVTATDVKKAVALVDEYKGLTKVDSFIMRGPIERLKDVLDDNGIASVVKTNSNPRYVLDNYELYVKNEDVKLVIPFITGEKLTGWTVVKSCYRTRQARFRVELLNEIHIPSIVIKKRDNNFMKSEILIYVKDIDKVAAEEALNKLPNWVKVGSYENHTQAEIKEKQLATANIRTIIEKRDANLFDIYVEGINKVKAEDVINVNIVWKLVHSFISGVEADFAVALLESQGIDAVALNCTDLFGVNEDVRVYVEEFQLDKAIEILNTISTSQNE
ncbi:MAG: DUF2007 domain-containing protein [Bacteroidales bacterium]|jgi:hypothetical protein|nr:DUF2007 domain-containing protein [Bacteroidales bacterium]